MLASAASSYLNRWAVKPGSRAVVFTNNEGGYRAALDLKSRGVDLAAVIDLQLAAEGPLSRRARDEDPYQDWLCRHWYERPSAPEEGLCRASGWSG